MVLRPAVYKGEYDTLQTLDERRLQITLELKNLKRRACRLSTVADRRRHDEYIALTGSDGISLASDGWAFPDDEHWLAAGARGPALLGQQPTSDVLLFMPPARSGRRPAPGSSREKHRPAGYDVAIRIPASMVRVQGDERMTR